MEKIFKALSSFVIILLVYIGLKAWAQSTNIIARITFWMFLGYVVYHLFDTIVFNPVPEPLFGNPYK
jgi:hypothetical protein